MTSSHQDMFDAAAKNRFLPQPQAGPGGVAAMTIASGLARTAG